MRKIRVLGVAAAATGLLFAGAGLASADGAAPTTPTTGSAEILTNVIKALITGSASTPGTTPPATTGN
ncbi:chaplin [Nocardia sp. NPDC004860]|uniref:chaplin n=1 Tax=Nocardia sp. NPDC004860 TaxID=3154557 RepID=UPI0033B92171